MANQSQLQMFKDTAKLLKSDPQSYIAKQAICLTIVWTPPAKCHTQRVSPLLKMPFAQFATCLKRSSGYNFRVNMSILVDIFTSVRYTCSYIFKYVLIGI